MVLNLLSALLEELTPGPVGVDIRGAAVAALQVTAVTADAAVTCEVAQTFPVSKLVIGVGSYLDIVVRSADVTGGGT